MNSLPPEVLHEICKLSCVSSLPNTRLVCKKISAAASQVMFRHAKIRYRFPLVDFLQMLRAISSGRHPYTEHAKTLTIEAIGPESNIPFEEIGENEGEKYHRHVVQPYRSRTKIIKQLLRRSILSCRRVTSVTWTVRDYTSDYGGRDVVLAAIKKLPLLTSVKLDISRDTYGLLFDTLPPLETLIITKSYDLSIPGLPELLQKSSEKLRALEVRPRYSTQQFMSSLIRGTQLQVTTLKLNGGVLLDKASIDSFRRLKTLHLLADSTNSIRANTTPKHDLWKLLKEERVHLEYIVYNETDGSFVEYLRSYTGLKSLILNEDYPSNDITLDNYLDSLSSHASTLEDLYITFSENHPDWNFKQPNTPALQRLVNLKSLLLTISAESISSVRRGHGKKEFGVTNDYNPSHPACILLEAASGLPHLELLSINFSSLPRLPRLLRIVMEHEVYPTVQIDTQVQLHGPLDPEKYKFDVRCLNRYYKLSRVVDDGCWYRYAGQAADVDDK